MPGAYVLDTHTFIWHLQDAPKLSATARKILDRVDQAELQAIVPGIVGIEIVYLAEKHRIPEPLVERTLETFRSNGNFRLAPLDYAVIDSLQKIPRKTVPDIPDRIIAATAMAWQAPLLTRDGAITSFDGIEVIW